MNPGFAAHDYAKWKKTYWVFGGYFVFCVLSVALAPATYTAHLPASAAFARVSEFPATAAFCLESMLAALPLALIAVALATPLKWRKGRMGADGALGALAAFLLFGLIFTPLLLYFVTFNDSVELERVTKVGRLVYDAAHNKVGLVFCSSFYFFVILSCSWIAYVAAPVSIFKIINEAEA